MRRFVAVLFLLSLLPSVARAQNQAPTAEPQTVYTEGPVEITLRGSDPEGRDLRFAIVELPRYGRVSEPEPIVPPMETDPRTGEPYQPPVTSARVIYEPFELAPDAFTFAAIDVEGASGTAVVTINPPSEEPPPPPVETITAHDVEGDEVLGNTTETITLSASAPEGVRVEFTLLSLPRAGELGELTHTSERTASMTYTPEPEFTGEDGFEFQACGDINGKWICDAGVYMIRVIEPPVEEPRLVTDVHVKSGINEAVTFSLANDNRAPVEDRGVVERAIVAGEVYRDGVEVPVLMSANESAQIQMEFDLSHLAEYRGRITRANVLLHTHRVREEGDATSFHLAGEGADGELTSRDYSAPAERIRGAVMTIPSTKEMPVGSDGTFSFEILGQLQDALDRGERVLALQGRASIGGLHVRSTAEENLKLDLQPRIVVETVRPPDPLVYTLTSLPEAGWLYDSAGVQIRELPYRLPDPFVTFKPPKAFTGKLSWWFEGTNGIAVDFAQVILEVALGRCQDDAKYCDNGR